MINLAEAEKIRPRVLNWIASWHNAQSSHPGWLVMANTDTLASGIATSGVGVFGGTVPRALTVVSWAQACYVATTNNSSNYWKIALYRYTTSSIKIAEIDTSRISAATWQVLSVTIGQAIPSTDKLIYIYVTKQGSPGALSLAGPAVWVR